MASAERVEPTHEAKSLRAMKAFRRAVRRAVEVLGTEAAAIEALKMLVHQEGEGEEASRVPPVIRFPGEPSHAAAIRVMERMEKDGRSKQEVRRAVEEMFPGRTREFVRRRFQVYQEMIDDKRARASVAGSPKKTG